MPISEATKNEIRKRAQQLELLAEHAPLRLCRTHGNGGARARRGRARARAQAQNQRCKRRDSNEGCHRSFVRSVDMRHFETSNAHLRVAVPAVGMVKLLQERKATLEAMVAEGFAQRFAS